MALRCSVLGFSFMSNSRASATKKTHIPLALVGSRPFAFPATPVCAKPLHRSTAVAALPLSLPPLLDPRVVSTSVNSSLNLISLCGFIILMQKYGYLPLSTAPVLSQVSFNLLIPCFLMSKVSKTISQQQDWTFLSLPLIALLQVIIGGILGKLACIFLYKRSSIPASEGGNNDMLAKEALITTACAFGNTVTLPLVFLNGMLSQLDYSAAAGYLALFTIGWSPCLWTLGYQILSMTSGPLEPANKNLEFSLHKLVNWWKKLVNPPLYGVLMGILIGATPLAYLCLPTNHVFDAGRTRGFLLPICSLLATILKPILEGANLLGSATVPLQTIVLASTLASSIGFEDNKERFLTRMDGTTGSLHESYTANGNMVEVEGKAFWTITVIRLLVMPLLNFTFLIAFQHHSWLPNNPLSRLILLVVAAMPTAQTLVVMAQLHPNTRPFAGVLANILVRQYLISVLSLTLWLPIFFSYLRLH